MHKRIYIVSKLLLLQLFNPFHFKRLNKSSRWIKMYWRKIGHGVNWKLGVTDNSNELIIYICIGIFQKGLKFSSVLKVSLRNILHKNSLIVSLASLHLLKLYLIKMKWNPLSKLSPWLYHCNFTHNYTSSKTYDKRSTFCLAIANKSIKINMNIL